jgi:predicted RNase H-like nuclease (RuvC/YqgF family)
MTTISSSMPEKISQASASFFTKINTLTSKFPSLLDDFKKSYIQFNMNPNINEYRNIYSKMKSGLEHINNEVVSTSETLQKKIQKLLELITILDEKLLEEKELNQDLTMAWEHTQGTDSGSQLMIDDSKELYRLQRLANIDIILGIILMIVLLFRVFRSSTTSAPIK